MRGFGRMLTLSVLWSAVSYAQDIAVPISAQHPLLLKILVFDHSFEARFGDELVMGIVYQREYRRSLSVKDILVRTIEESPLRTVKGVPLRQVAIDVSRQPDLAGELARHQVDIIYVAPLRAFDLEQIVRISRDRKVTTLTGIPDYCEAGIAVGIGQRGEKPEIVINLKGARAEGAEFSSRLLRLCKIVQ